MACLESHRKWQNLAPGPDLLTASTGHTLTPFESDGRGVIKMKDIKATTKRSRCSVGPGCRSGDFLKLAMLNLKGHVANSQGQYRAHHSLRARACLQSRDRGSPAGWGDTAGLTPDKTLLLQGCLWSWGRDFHGIREEGKEAGRRGQGGRELPVAAELYSCLWPLLPFQGERGGIQGLGLYS